MLLQECWAPAGAEWTSCSDYVFIHSAMTTKKSGVVIGIRSDLGKRLKVKVVEVHRHFVMIEMQERSGGETLRAASMYLPPQGNTRWDEAAAKTFLQMCDDAGLVGEDFNYRPTETTAAEIWEQPTLEEPKPSGWAGWKVKEATRDMLMRTWWPRRLATAKPQTTAAWTTRTCWRTGAGYQVD